MKGRLQHQPARQPHADQCVPVRRHRLQRLELAHRARLELPASAAVAAASAAERKRAQVVRSHLVKVVRRLLLGRRRGGAQRGRGSLLRRVDDAERAACGSDVGAHLELLPLEGLHLRLGDGASARRACPARGTSSADGSSRGGGGGGGGRKWWRRRRSSLLAHWRHWWRPRCWPWRGGALKRLRLLQEVLQRLERARRRQRPRPVVAARGAGVEGKAGEAEGLPAGGVPMGRRHGRVTDVSCEAEGGCCSVSCRPMARLKAAFEWRIVR